MTILGIVIPCYNEEQVIQKTEEKLSYILNKLVLDYKISEKSFLLFVDDGSKDKTWMILKKLKIQSEHVRAIRLSTNCGHQNALLAGLMEAKNEADCVISIDADLQQDENAIYDFLEKYKEGYDIVYGVRNNRNTDGFLKKITALFFYKLMHIMGVNIIKNHADYRLTSSKVLEALSSFEEVNLFLRGLFPVLGFKSTIVYFDVRERFAGESKYSLKKMLYFALDGITSFSIVPMKLITTVGFVVFIFSILMSIYTIYSKIVYDTTPGWASILLPLYFLGGIQLLSLGVIGEYIGKIYKESKKRPRFIIEETLK